MLSTIEVAVNSGGSFNYTVFADSFKTQNRTIDHIYEDTDLNIELEVE